ncbi:unnamed protein product [Bursaphelenchus okinawaensis]|uniref:Uncharacterized protein n=1 Tax=Bursaphelenchus okinawaensis TaxID=465554 RepID=A0A811JVM6_9BILA|nr:unnamed protein product [Bursaphelenchus okinawaensis]CAG9085169.1 unnamed protein product [Bursaphelenchus okinawaensis]
MKAFNTNKDTVNLSYDYLFQRIKYRPFEYFHDATDLDKETTEDWLDEIENITKAYQGICQAAKEYDITIDHFFADIRLAFPYNAIVEADPSTLFENSVHLVYREHLGRYGYVLNSQETHLISLQLPTFIPTNLHNQVTPFRAEMKCSEWRYREDVKLDDFFELEDNKLVIDSLNGSVSVDTYLGSVDEEYYVRCFENLKKSNENVKVLTIEGGHKVRITTHSTKDLDNEIKTLLTSIRSVVRASKAAELPLQFFVYHTEWYFDYSKRPQSFDFEKIIQRYVNTDSVDTNTFTFDYNVEGLVVVVHIRMIFDSRPFTVPIPKKQAFYTNDQYPVRSFIDLTSTTLQIKFLEDLPYIAEPFTESAVRSLHKLQRIYIDPLNRHKNPIEFYKKCVNILKEYRYIDEPLGLYCESTNEVTRDIEAEFDTLRQNLNGIFEAFLEGKMEIRTSTLIVDLVVDEKEVEESNWSELMKTYFNCTVNDLQLQEKMLVFEYVVKENKARVLFGFNMGNNRPSGFQLNFFNDHV